jgi:transposase
MKKNTTGTKTRKAQVKAKQQLRERAAAERLTIGLDLGDRTFHYCILDEAGEVVSEGTWPTSRAGLSSLLQKMAPSRVAMEVGTHSPWISQHVSRMGHEVIVANARRVKLISESIQKNDRIDARTLARLARVDPKLLAPIQHRGEKAQQDLAVIRARAGLVEARTKLINTVRGLVKPMGERLKKCDAEQVGEGMLEGMSEAARRTLGSLMRCIEKVNEEVGKYDEQIEEIGKEYGELKLLTQVHGVGTLTALTYLLTIDDANRFVHSRDVGPYLGLRPRQKESGQSRPELGISKAGDRLLRAIWCKQRIVICGRMRRRAICGRGGRIKQAPGRGRNGGRWWRWRGN